MSKVPLSEEIKSAEGTVGTCKELVILQQTLAQDIDDIIDENSIDDFNESIEDIDSVVQKLEIARSNYRKIYLELNTHVDASEDDVQHRLESIKTYIKDLKHLRKSIRNHEVQGKIASKEMAARCLTFDIDTINHTIRDLELEVTVITGKLQDDELIRRKNDVPEIKRKFENLSTRMKELLNKPADQDIILNFKQRYDKLQIAINSYCLRIFKEVELRELNKRMLFKDSLLNIKLTKFKGYSSEIDIYSFQSDFEKVHLRTTPNYILPDLLKNNYLEEPALSLVKALDDINLIWERLKMAYGDPKTMLMKKLSQLNNFDLFPKFKDQEKLAENLSKIISLIKDLINLSKKHNIEQKLYNGDALEKIFKLIGDARVTRWLSSICDEDITDEEYWQKLILFLEKDMKVQYQKLLYKPKYSEELKPPSRIKQSAHFSEFNNGEKNACSFCGESDHVYTTGPAGTSIIQYFACKKFVDMTPNQRFLELRNKGFCFQCLFPGANANKGKHREGKCQRDFTCKHESHSKYPSKKHVLVCHEHKNDSKNIELLQIYKDRCILRQDVPNFSKEIKLSFCATTLHSGIAYQTTHQTNAANKSIDGEIVNNKAIYQLQTIKVNKQRYTLFFDSGCGDFVSRYKSVKNIGAKLEAKGPINLGGVGGITTKSTHGIYTVKLPLVNGDFATMTGVCLDKITSTFPTYPLSGKVQSDIETAYKKLNCDISKLPIIPKSVGGDVDFLIGIKYLRYHPELVFSLPSGLSIFKSVFENADGGNGIIGGPHEVFTAIENHFQLINNHNLTFFSNQYKLYQCGYQINPDVSLLGYKEINDDDLQNDEFDSTIHTSKHIRKFQQVEETGTVINFRCIKCRNCKECKEHDRNEIISIKEEVEQDIINRSVNVDINSRTTTATLPFIHDATIKLSPNKETAMSIFNQQLRKLNNNPKDKDDVLKSENKLQTLGHVDYVKNLTIKQQQILKDSITQNFIPWRAIWKENSVSTPCRIVFDASQPTNSGYSLNDLLAKGRNNMNKLQEIFIRWCTHKVAFHTDVQKMYNTVKLKEEHWCYQRYIWQENLDPKLIPEEKVIKTLIYGVKSSGNQAEFALRETAKQSKHEYQEVYNIIRNDVYVDDCLSGEESHLYATKRADELEGVLNRGGFSLKGFTISGNNPPQVLTNDEISVSVGGMKWYSKEDYIKLDINELNFAKKCRGRKPKQLLDIPLKLTRRMCASKVGEVFDLVGRITPITAGMKIDLHHLIQRNLDWDDVLPDNLRALWTSNFEMINELKTLKYQRSVVPDDAVNLDLHTLDFGDASQKMSCAAIYVRFQRKNGEFSCQLLLSRSKIIPDNSSQPRAELCAAVLNSHSGEVVQRALKKHHKYNVKLTDSQVVLHWICNDERPLKQWVRNRVIEIKRFTDPNDWLYIDSVNMIADIGTRKGATINDITADSTWINGYQWMTKNAIHFPTKRRDEIILTSDDVKYTNENQLSVFISKSTIPKEVKERYELSCYLINPFKYRFQVIVRILAIVIKFINNLKSSKVSKQQNQLHGIRAVFLNDDEINNGKQYFFKQATIEVKQFNKKSNYEKFSNERNGILMYTGRILPSNNITVVGKMTEIMKDLSSTSFCVPIIDKHSPLAYSIINDVHWYSEIKHQGVETTWRYVLKIAYIIEGRDIVKKIRNNCERCRYLMKRTIEVEMGPVSNFNLIIAPAFYVTQVDLAGPFKAYSVHNKRTSIKIWFSIFCCATTSSISIKVMENYSATSFIQSFIRFSCDVGFPKMLLPDEGSQLLKACENMKINFNDIKYRLNKDIAVEFNVCPVGGHHMHGKVERKIREVKASIEKSVQNERLSILQWETICAQISNSINNLPLGLRNHVSNFESMDLITPNRLKLGRNNERSPTGNLITINSYDKILENNTNIFNSWFENWLMVHVPKLMYHPKWFKSNRVRYQNFNEKTHRETSRAIRQLVLIHEIDELNIMKELYDISIQVDNKYKQQ